MVNEMFSKLRIQKKPHWSVFANPSQEMQVAKLILRGFSQKPRGLSLGRRDYSIKSMAGKHVLFSCLWSLTFVFLTLNPATSHGLLSLEPQVQAGSQACLHAVQWFELSSS